MFKPLFIIAALFALSGAAGPVSCSQRVADDEAKLLALAQQVRAGAAVAAQDIQSGIDLLCNNGAAVNAGVQGIKSVIASGGPGPKTSQNLAAADKSLAVLNGVCSQPSGSSSGTLLALFRQGYAAYLAAKNAANLATANATNGT